MITKLQCMDNRSPNSTNRLARSAAVRQVILLINIDRLDELLFLRLLLLLLLQLLIATRTFSR